MDREEIQPVEFLRYAPQLEAALEAVCRSQSFRTSVKSCQFLRHIVRQTLHGNVDELKERLIGMALLGRDASYDTGSDAGVRVRANDVRKRLAAYYAAGCPDDEFTFDLPAGSYVPRFHQPRIFSAAESVPASPNSAAPVTAPLSMPALVVDSPPAMLGAQPAEQLSLLLLALPTVAALFFCLVSVRWQITREHPFVSFWNTVFQEHHALLYVPAARADGQQEVIPADQLEDAAPLFNLAGRFHARITLTHSLDADGGPNDILILIGHPSIPAAADDDRLAVEASPSGRRILDRAASVPGAGSYGEAALLTISNGPQRSIHIDGTDEAATASLIRDLSDSSVFPDGLADSFRDGTVTQVVFPINPGAHAVVFHEPLPNTRAAMSGPQ